MKTETGIQVSKDQNVVLVHMF